MATSSHHDPDEEEEVPFITEPPDLLDTYVSYEPDDEQDDPPTSSSATPEAKSIINKALDDATREWRRYKERICRTMATHYVFVRAEERNFPFEHIGGERMLHRAINNEKNEIQVIESASVGWENSDLKRLLAKILRSKVEVEMWDEKDILMSQVAEMSSDTTDEQPQLKRQRGPT
ncbi:MAG: hypothetical protein Q9163_002428 [Psora crenata]